MDNKTEKTPQELNDQENNELREGQMLYEMVKTCAGWQVISKRLEDAAYHSWVDPRDVKDKGEWEWRELNGFHAANAAREILEYIAQSISRSEYLDKVKSGEIERRKGMKI